MIHKSGIVNGKRVYEDPFSRPLPDTATDLRFSISSCQVWRPGIYDSERAARYAFRFRDADLQALQDRCNAEGEARYIACHGEAALRDLRARMEAANYSGEVMAEADRELSGPAITFEMLQALRRAHTGC